MGWQYRLLPGNDGKLGTTKVVNINDDNPFGINLDDPYGRDDVMVQSDIINLENNRPVKILLRSVDVFIIGTCLNLEQRWTLSLEL